MVIKPSEPKDNPGDPMDERKLDFRFTRLAVVYTDPAYWEVSPVALARELYRFLASIINASDGQAWLGIETEGSTEWKSEKEEILQDLAQIYHDVWYSWSNRLAQQQAKGRDVYEAFVQKKLTIFIDKARFQSVYRQNLGKTEELLRLLSQSITGRIGAAFSSEKALSAKLENIKGEYYIAFCIDWEYMNALIFTPQLRITNFWPEDDSIAPPASEKSYFPTSIRLNDASEWLIKTAWETVASAFRTLRYQFNLGSADVRFQYTQWHPPVFFYAEPFTMPAEPTYYLRREPFSSGVEQLAKETLSSSNLSSSDVAGGVVLGNLLTIRRETHADKSVQARYLILPWYRPERDPQQSAEVERNLSFTASRWTFIEFLGVNSVYQPLRGLEYWTPRVTLLLKRVENLLRIAQHIQQAVSIEEGYKRARLFLSARRLHSALSHVEPDIIQISNNAFALERQLCSLLNETHSQLRLYLPMRSIEPMSSFEDRVDDFFPFRKMREESVSVKMAADELLHIRDYLKEVLLGLFDLQERDEREQVSKHQSLLNLSLLSLSTILALAGPFVLLFSFVRISQGNDFLSQFAELALEIGIPQLVTVMLATISIGLWVVMAKRFWDALRKKRISYLLRDPVTDTQKVCEAIIKAWQNVHRATPLLNSLVKGGLDDDKIRATLSELERLDIDATQHLCSVWEWLRNARGTLNDMSDWVKWLQRIVHYTVVEVELLDGRPEHLGLIRTLCLLRYKSLDFLEETIVQYSEFEMLLKVYGYTELEIELIDRIALSLRDESAQEFVQRLKSLGIDAHRTLTRGQLMEELMRLYVQQRPKEVAKSEDIASTPVQEATTVASIETTR